jgi:hypothetical protein
VTGEEFCCRLMTRPTITITTITAIAMPPMIIWVRFASRDISRVEATDWRPPEVDTAAGVVAAGVRADCRPVGPPGFAELFAGPDRCPLGVR